MKTPGPILATQLVVQRCPHCNVDQPSIILLGGHMDTNNHTNTKKRTWAIYRCNRCGGCVLCCSISGVGHVITEMYPKPDTVSDSIPPNARQFLEDAIMSRAARSASIMSANSSIDAMLKHKKYTDGHLYPRIEQAAKEHVITQAMAEWAHDVRMIANDMRHADVDAPAPTDEDVDGCIEFAKALAEYLFVLPERVRRSRSTKSSEATPQP